ncbi:hypothetical protein MKW92_014876 [Papaver armeniacum]|nr:hypothetical protein MKW92_014876 [Papaver armeniacum]
MAFSSLLSLSTSVPTTRVTGVHPLTSSPFKVTLHVKASSAPTPTAGVSSPTLRLDNLRPQPGSRHRKKRKGIGIAAGQGNSCGGQMPLYRRVPKLRGIAGGMKAGILKYLPVNLKDKATLLICLSLGTGDLDGKLIIKACSFSTSAKEKKKKWVKPSVTKNLARADAYFAKKKRADAEANC